MKNYGKCCSQGYRGKNIFLYLHAANAFSVKHITIAIDGYSSCGKSTLAIDLARELQYSHIDSGAMYRAVTLFIIEREIDVNNRPKVIDQLPEIQIRFDVVDGANHTFLNDRDVEKDIRQLIVSQSVSQIAAIPEVRHTLVALQQAMDRSKGIVMDGRDIGTVVFPRAELKLFLTAEIEERVQRRLLELQQKGMEADYDSVKENLMNRDRIDTTRKESPLRQAIDAVLIDNTNLNRREQLAMTLALAHERIKYG